MTQFIFEPINWSPFLGVESPDVPRLVRATVAGQYQGTSVGRLVLMLAAAGYVVSPVDLMPEGLLGVFGLADDAMVLSWLATRLVEETEQFLEWEREQGAMPPTAGPDGSASGTTPSQAPTSAAASQTIPGDVVR